MTARIIVVGGGFVGLPAAKRIARLMGSDAQVTLIDPRENFVFLPRLTDALEDGIDTAHLIAAYAPLAKKHGFSFIQASVSQVDREAKKLTYILPSGASQDMPYDVLVYCPGSATNFYGTPGAEEHSLTLKSWDDVQRIHARVDELIAEAHADSDEDKKCHMLSFVVVGAGPTGLEGVFALKRLVTDKIQEQAPELAKCVSYALVQAAPQILPGMDARIVDGAGMQLQRKGVTVFISEPVIAIDEKVVHTAHRRTIQAGLVLWAAGIKRQIIPIMPVVAEDNGHYLLVDSMLRLDPAILAAGDAVTYREKELVVPKNAQTAYLMSRTIADNAVSLIRNRPLKPFHYHSNGTFLPLDDTGFIKFGPFVLKSRLAQSIRAYYYNKIHRDISS